MSGWVLRNTFHIAAHGLVSKQGNLPLVQQFLEADTPVDLEDTTEFGDGYCPLHYAAYGGHVAICSLLLKQGANVNGVNKAGCTALFLAAQQQHWAVCHLLLDHRADPTISDPVHQLCAADVCEHEQIMASIRAHPHFLAPTDVAEITAAAINSPHAAIRIKFQLPDSTRDTKQGLPHREWIVRVCHADSNQPEDTPLTLATTTVPFDPSSDRLTIKCEEVVEWFRKHVLKEEAPLQASADKQAQQKLSNAPCKPDKAANQRGQRSSKAKPERKSNKNDSPPEDNDEKSSSSHNDNHPSTVDDVAQPKSPYHDLPVVVPLVVSIAIANAADVGPWSNAAQLKVVVSRNAASIAEASEKGSDAESVTSKSTTRSKRQT